MKGSKKILAAFVAALMVVGSALPVLATDAGSTTSTTAASGTQVQITKTLKIGRGITVPGEEFKFEFASATAEEAADLKATGTYVIPNDPASGNVTYPDLNTLNAEVAYTAASRDKDGTDTELTFLSDIIDLADSSLTWPVPGLYIYSVKETAGSTSGMTYDDTVYFLKVFVQNGDSGNTVSSVNVWGKKENGAGTVEWTKINGAPTTDKESWSSDANDGSEDFTGNEFKFVNTYAKLVDLHPTDPKTTSEDDQSVTANPGAFKLTKDVSGKYASQDYGFCINVKLHLPEILPDGYDAQNISAKVNGYTAAVNELGTFTEEQYGNIVDVLLKPDKEYKIYLRHANSFIINKLPAGTTIDAEEEATEMKYIPSFEGKWGDISKDRSGSGEKNKELATPTIVVGDEGAFVHFTNTLKDDDVTTTGIVINNLPYIMMVGIGLAGICFFMISKKRRSA